MNEAFKYAPYYCEENVWHLCREPRFERSDLKVLFISNLAGTCALWSQRAAPAASIPVVWDYHVVLVARESVEVSVWDLDSTLELPVGLSAYLEGTFRPLAQPSSSLAPLFRVVEASTYRTEFSSDRAHMRRPDGSWSQPPPPWPAVVRRGAPSFIRWAVMSEGDRDVVPLERIRSVLAPGG